MRQQHSALRIAGIRLGLRGCPMVNRCREFGATDELCLGGRQVDQGEITWGKSVAMSLVATDPPCLRLEKHTDLLSISVGEVEQIMRHAPRLPTHSSGDRGNRWSGITTTQQSVTRRRAGPGSGVSPEREPGVRGVCLHYRAS